MWHLQQIICTWYGSGRVTPGDSLEEPIGFGIKPTASKQIQNMLFFPLSYISDPMSA